MITNFENTDNIENFTQSGIETFKETGNKLILNNKIGVIVLAGGQGSRLGLNKPKGTLELNGKSLFQIHIEKIKKFAVKMPLYIMTSYNTHEDTINFFKINDYFGLDKNDVIFFEQGNNYCLDNNRNKIVLNYDNDKPIYTTCPNGNGGIYKAIYDNGLYDDFLERGLKYLFIQNVDNPMVKLCDPLMIGHAEHNNLDVSCKVCQKNDPEEKVGIYCYKNNVPCIVEYYELSDEMRNLRDVGNNLTYNQANISIHLLSVDFIGKLRGIELECHYAWKKIMQWDEKLKHSVKPEKENGYKPEYFIFDAFKLCPKEKMKLLIVPRELEFCPIKNKEHVAIAERKLKENI